MKRVLKIAVWTGIALLGAGALSAIALHRGEALNATWFVVAAGCCYLVAFRLYSAFISAKLLVLDDTRATPAERLDDGRAIRLLAWHALADRRRGVRRMRAGLYHFVLLNSPQRQVPR